MIAACLLCGLPGMVLAQGAAVSVGDGHDPDEPVEVTSDSLSFDQDSGIAIFTGNVVIVQSNMRMTAPRVEVTYDDTDSGGEIRQMLATGGVTYSADGDVAESREATYDPESGLLQMRQDVIVTQGRTAIAGQVLDLDMETGSGVMTGRVRAVLPPSRDEDDDG